MADYNIGGPLVGTTTTNELARDVYVETLEAFNRATVFKNLIYVQTIQQGKSAQFIVGGKTSTDTVGSDATTKDGTYSRGDKVTYGAGTFDERNVILQKPLYSARVIDQFDEKIAHYPTRSIITGQMGEVLANELDRSVAAELFSDDTANTGLAGNPDEVSTILTDVSNASGAEAKGDAIAEAIFAAKAGLEGNDDIGEAVCVLSPVNYSYLVQSKKAINADYNQAGANGSYAMGTIMEVGGVKVYKSNNIPATISNGATTTSAVGVVFTRQAVGLVELVGLQTKQEKDIDMLDATKMVAYYMNGVDLLRPESKVMLGDGAFA